MRSIKRGVLPLMQCLHLTMKRTNNIFLCGITVVHERVLNCHIYRWKEQNNYAGEK